MRTTLTLDKDVAALLRRVQHNRGISFKQAVNEALRQGLVRQERPSPGRKPFKTSSAHLGRCLIGRLDDVSNALAVAEGERFK